MDRTKRPLDRLAERVFGPVWSGRIAMLALSAFLAVTVLAAHGWRRVIAGVVLALLIVLGTLEAWEQTHTRAKRRRSREKTPIDE